MTEKAPDPVQPANDEARSLARKIWQEARFAALATLQAGAPFVTRVALVPEDGACLTLISDLASHTQHLRTDPRAALLIGEPGAKGDPLTHPRMTWEVEAQFIEKTDAKVAAYLALQPKAKLYIGFGDFNLVRLTPSAIHLNGGFGKAFRLAPADLTG
ncbi:MAG: pyridoxamine 5'-phosphate oxidase family protein [Silicimonas sp.]|nr:pyridoxamine 5'-phosphate oxidase family protein [Silicimonas sp.]